MEVGRLYELDRTWYSLKRLWSRVTVFDEFDSATGRSMNLKRLKEFHEGIGEVIAELETEKEMTAWLE